MNNNIFERLLRDSMNSSWDHAPGLEEYDVEIDEIFKSTLEDMYEAMGAFGRRKPKRGFFDE